jgi:hypothetical protein
VADPSIEQRKTEDSKSVLCGSEAPEDCFGVDLTWVVLDAIFITFTPTTGQYVSEQTAPRRDFAPIHKNTGLVPTNDNLQAVLCYLGVEVPQTGRKSGADASSGQQTRTTQRSPTDWSLARLQEGTAGAHLKEQARLLA